jgi:hypothetical protein
MVFRNVNSRVLTDKNTDVSEECAVEDGSNRLLQIVGTYTPKFPRVMSHKTAIFSCINIYGNALYIHESFSPAQQPNAGQGRLIFEVSRTHKITS